MIAQFEEERLKEMSFKKICIKKEQKKSLLEILRKFYVDAKKSGFHSLFLEIHNEFIESLKADNEIAIVKLFDLEVLELLLNNLENYSKNLENRHELLLLVQRELKNMADN